jgi:hypothetical protein
MQTWDVNKPAPDTLGGPFDLILASNAVHTCDNMAGETLNWLVHSLQEKNLVSMGALCALQLRLSWGTMSRRCANLNNCSVALQRRWPTSTDLWQTGASCCCMRPLQRSQHACGAWMSAPGSLQTSVSMASGWPSHAGTAFGSRLASPRSLSTGAQPHPFSHSNLGSDSEIIAEEDCCRPWVCRDEVMRGSPSRCMCAQVPT